MKHRVLRYKSVFFSIVAFVSMLTGIASACGDPFADTEVTLKPAYVDRGAEKDRTELAQVKVITVKCAHYEYPDKQLTKRIKADANLPKTKTSDVVYDVSSDFPNALKPKGGGIQQWVYYNQTSGYLIANADAFLEASIRNYVFTIQWNTPVNVTLSGMYIEVDDGVEPNLKAIAKHEYHIIYKFRFSDVQGVATKSDNKSKSISLGSTIYRASLDLVSGELNFMNNDHGIDFNFHLQLGSTRIFEVGVSRDGKKKLMILKAEHVDLDNEIIHRPSQDTSRWCRAEKVKFSLSEQNDLECLKYHLPVEFHQLLKDSYQKPCVTPTLPEQKSREHAWYDLSELLRENGFLLNDKEWVKYNRHTSEAYCFLSKKNHDILVNLLEDVRDGGSPASIVTEAHFYEIDTTPTNLLRKQWSLIDLMKQQPKHLARLGMINVSGDICRVYNDPIIGVDANSESDGIEEITLQTSLQDIENQMDAAWLFNIHLNGHRIARKESLTATNRKSYIIPFTSTGKDGKMVIMVATTKTLRGYEK